MALWAPAAAMGMDCDGGWASGLAATRVLGVMEAAEGHGFCPLWTPRVVHYTSPAVMTKGRLAPPGASFGQGQRSRAAITWQYASPFGPGATRESALYACRVRRQSLSRMNLKKRLVFPSAVLS